MLEEGRPLNLLGQFIVRASNPFPQYVRLASPTVRYPRNQAIMQDLGGTKINDLHTVGVKLKFPFTVCLRTLHHLNGNSFS